MKVDVVDARPFDKPLRRLMRFDVPTRYFVFVVLSVKYGSFPGGQLKTPIRLSALECSFAQLPSVLHDLHHLHVPWLREGGKGF